MGLSPEGAVEALRVISTVMAGIMLWDHLSTLPLEYKLFWSRPGWNLAKVLYLANRYVTLAMYSAFVWPLWVSDIPLSVCKNLVFVGPVTPVLTFFFSNMIFLLRCCAIWSWNRAVTGFLAAFIAFNIVMGSWCTSGTYVVGPTSRGCWVGGRRDLHGAFWFAACAYDLATFVLSTVRVFKLRQGGTHSDLSYILLRDGIVYFLVVFAVNFANAMFYAAGSPLVMSLLTGPVIVLTSILAARLMLNLKGYPDNTPSSYARPTGGSNSAARAAAAIREDDTGMGSVPSYTVGSFQSRLPASAYFKKHPVASPPPLSPPRSGTFSSSKGRGAGLTRSESSASDWKRMERKQSDSTSGHGHGTASEWAAPLGWGSRPSSANTPKRADSLPPTSPGGAYRVARVPVPAGGSPPPPMPAPPSATLQYPPPASAGPYTPISGGSLPSPYPPATADSYSPATAETPYGVYGGGR